MNNIIENIELIIERFTITSQLSRESMLIAPVYNAHFFCAEKGPKIEMRIIHGILCFRLVSLISM